MDSIREAKLVQMYPVQNVNKEHVRETARKIPMVDNVCNENQTWYLWFRIVSTRQR